MENRYRFCIWVKLFSRRRQVNKKSPIHIFLNYFAIRKTGACRWLLPPKAQAILAARKTRRAAFNLTRATRYGLVCVLAARVRYRRGGPRVSPPDEVKMGVDRPSPSKRATRLEEPDGADRGLPGDGPYPDTPRAEAGDVVRAVKDRVGELSRDAVLRPVALVAPRLEVHRARPFAA